MKVPPFDYGLEPLRQQAVWQLDAALGELALGVRKLEALHTLAKAHERHVAGLLEWMTPKSSLSLDPGVSRNRLAYLSQASEKIRAFDRDIQQAKAEIEQLQARCHERQLKLDALEQHRRDAEHEHRQAQAQKGATQADDDWLVRSHWTGQQASGSLLQEGEPA
jgi:septal ring factor EnvC (AmiA/AmiB activator)